jgi:glutamine cyclotransferase
MAEYYICQNLKSFRMHKYLFIASFIILTSCTNNEPIKDNTEDKPAISTGLPVPQNISLNIVGIYPHDDSAYTQGLEIYNGKFYEGTGDYVNSSLRISDIKTGKVEHKHFMGTKNIFGEGITIFNGKIYQLTWQSHIVNVYDINNIDKPIKTFPWPYDGWGITHNATELIVSDGTANIYKVDPETFKIKSTLQINDNTGPVDSINELEMIDGFLFANVYLSDFILKIDPSNGHIVGKIDLPGLIQQHASGYIPKDGEVLNGIAYDSTTRKVYITGKHWPKMFEATFN